jgi:hypothetical protein
MTDIFQPYQYEIPQPIPDEIVLIQNAWIEKYVVERIPCSQLIMSSEGFFRLNARRPSTEHSKYVNRKTLELYKVAKNLEPYSSIITIDYLLDSELFVRVYIRDDIKAMIGCIKGYRSEKMSAEEFQKLWYGEPPTVTDL